MKPVIRETELERLLEKAQAELALLKDIYLGYNTYQDVSDKIEKVCGK